MDLSLPVQIHLFTAIPAILLGVVNFSMTKGTTLHKRIGLVWVMLMLITSFSSFFIQSLGGYSWIHILSVVSIVNVVLGFIGIKLGKLKMHIGCITGAFFGLLFAGIFAVVLPGRFLFDKLMG